MHRRKKVEREINTEERQLFERYTQKKGRWARDTQKKLG
jgi:hypothetical protein